MSMMVSFCAVLFFPRDVLDEILNLIESVSEGFPSYFCQSHMAQMFEIWYLTLPSGLLPSLSKMNVPESKMVSG